jgi:hypothetical protein
MLVTLEELILIRVLCLYHVGDEPAPKTLPLSPRPAKRVSDNPLPWRTSIARMRVMIVIVAKLVVRLEIGFNA